jgi:hypothetical protein
MGTNTAELKWQSSDATILISLVEDTLAIKDKPPIDTNKEEWEPIVTKFKAQIGLLYAMTGSNVEGGIEKILNEIPKEIDILTNILIEIQKANQTAANKISSSRLATISSDISKLTTKEMRLTNELKETTRKTLTEKVKELAGKIWKAPNVVSFINGTSYKTNLEQVKTLVDTTAKEAQKLVNDATKTQKEAIKDYEKLRDPENTSQPTPQQLIQGTTAPRHP